MTPTPEVQARLRQYLLGQLDDDRREEIEKDLLANDEVFEELLVFEDELIDEYINGKLDDAERAAFEGHFLATPERHDKLKFGRAFNRYLFSQPMVETVPQSATRPQPTAASRWHFPGALFSSSVRITAFALLTIAVALGIWRIFFHKSEVDKGLIALNQAYREQRPIESRISGLSNYAPFPATRGGPDNQHIDALARERAELTLNNAVNDRGDSAAHHALGEVYLASKRFDDAITQFDLALKADPKNAQVYSDLGAAWLEKGKLDLERAGTDSRSLSGGKGVEELGRSLDDLNKAAELNPNLLEALFNRSMCHQLLGPPTQAADDWRAYLAKDSTSPWAEEARTKLKLLEQRSAAPRDKAQLLQGFLDAYQSRDADRVWELMGISRDDLSGTNIFQQVLDAYLDDTTNGRQVEAAVKLQELAYIGQVAVSKADERYDSDIAAFLRSLPPARLPTLVAARNFMKQGYEKYSRSRLNDAVEVFDKAGRSFEQSGDLVEVNHAKFWKAYCYLESLHTEDGLVILKYLARVCEKRHYRWLMMKTQQKLSSAQYNVNEYSKAIDYASGALALAQQLGDKIGTFDALDTLTELYRAINNYSKSLNAIAASRPLVDCCAFNPIKVWRHYAITASAFHSAGLHAPAIDCQKEAVRRALATGETSMVSLSYAHLGQMFGKAGDYEEGLANTKLAYETAAADSDEARGKEMMAYSSLQTGHLYRDDGECAKAIESYDKSIELYRFLKFPVQLYQAHKGRLICYLDEDKNSLASDELDAVLALAEKNRATIFEGDDRNRFFDIEQSVYDTGIVFAYQKLADSKRAFAYSEQSRARSLLDLLLRGKARTAGIGVRENSISQPLSISEISRRLAVDSQIIEYSVLADRIIIWVINREGLQAREKKIAKTDLEEKIRSYVESTTHPNYWSDSAKQGRELFELLIEPVEDLLDKKKLLDIVPDKFLNTLSFASLVTPSNKYLIEDFCIIYSPSATIFILKSNLSGADPGRPERLLSVGNPGFDHDAFPQLADLPSADREARAIAGYYEKPRVLIGPKARKETVIRAMVDADVVHLSLHAVEDKDEEKNSRLVLAKDHPGERINDDDGALRAHEVYGLSLPQTRLLVLSACQTGNGRYYDGEGTFSLARAFLVSGVPLVVASLWAVDSEATASLMIKFHEYRTQNHYSSARALQRAQLDMIGSADQRLRQPYYWASFVMQGGYATL